MNKAFKYRIYPNQEQQVLLNKTFGCTRFIWNQMLNDKKEYHEEHKKSLKVTPASYKKEYEWLKEVDSLSLANVQLQQEQAYKNFFKNPSHFEPPKFKSKHSCKQSYRTNCVNGNIRFEDGKLKLPKLGLVKTKLHRDLVGTLKSVTISKSASGKFYASILTEYHPVIEKKTDISKTVGLDMSMEHFYVTSEGTKAKFPRWYRKMQSKLIRAQRKLNKKQIGSKNRDRQRIRVAKIHEDITNHRKDFIEKHSTNLLKKYDYVVLEDINLSQMKRCLKLGKSVSDLGFGMFRDRLKQKADELGKRIVKLDKWFPSSKLCSFCGYVHKDLQIKDRIWSCSFCGTTHDRDINAAINLKKKFIEDTAGAVGFQACGEISSGSVETLSETNFVEAGSPRL